MMELQLDQAMDQKHLLVSKSSAESLSSSVGQEKRSSLRSRSSIRSSIGSTTASSVSPGLEPVKFKPDGLGISLSVSALPTRAPSPVTYAYVDQDDAVSFCDDDEPLPAPRPITPPMIVYRRSTSPVRSRRGSSPPSPVMIFPESPFLGSSRAAGVPIEILEAPSRSTTPHFFPPVPLSRRSSVSSLPPLPSSPPYSRTGSPQPSRAASPAPTSSGTSTPSSSRSASPIRMPGSPPVPYPYAPSPPSPIIMPRRHRRSRRYSYAESDIIVREPSPPPRPKTPIPPQPHFENPFVYTPSNAAQEWERRKREKDEKNDVMEELMRLEGLEEVKRQFLDIMSKVKICEKQGRDLKRERFNIVFQGNPGAGKTTVARLYAKFLHSVGILGSETFEETSGMKIAANGIMSVEQKIESIVSHGGGVLFVDEAYQLTAPYMDGLGRQALDVILTNMENHIGDLVVIFVGYKDEMESFFEHNPGLASRIPYTMNFADFSDAELWKILYDNIHNEFKGKMKVQEDMDGLYMRVAIRRLAQSRNSKGFGNARTVQNLFATITQRQARRLTEQERDGEEPDHLFLTKEDLIGPDPSTAAGKSAAWEDLKKLIGLEEVKKCVKSMIGMIQLNYRRELAERKPLRFSLNQLFVGCPGTGKTTVAKLYGDILADLGLLSRGDVVLKTPADFIGECLGKSEAKTRKILEATVGKVLVIDECYMLDPGDPHKEQDKFKTGVIDTLVSMVQGVPGEDRCIILVGYEDKVFDMFHNANPGLSRRFPIEQPFRFENFNNTQLEMILQKKMREQDVDCTPRALEAARDVLERALMRPKFTNAGEVDRCLATAKRNYEMRQSSKPVEEQDIEGILEPEDFDKDYDRGSRQGINTRDMLGGNVHDSIIQKLVGYQNRHHGARRHGLNPRDQVPTNFVFKGFPGTGKTTTAQHMGQLFYDMGFLSTAEVVELSATDLMGQYVGHTAPKTKKELEKALGKVLFIDEAYRLIYGQYANEAIDELIQFLTKPAHAGKMVVILAGYTEDMHLLMTSRPVLSGLFPEEIVFDNLVPEDCITLLVRELTLCQMSTEHDFLHYNTSADYMKVWRLFKTMQLVPSWSNARDVKHLAKQLLGRFLETMPAGSPRILSAALITECMWQMITQRRDRCTNLGTNGNASLPQQPPLAGCDPCTFAPPQSAPPPPAIDSSICTPGAGPKCTTGADINIDTGYSGGSSQPVRALMRVRTNSSTFSNGKDSKGAGGSGAREPSATDAQWKEVKAAQEDRKRLNMRIWQLQRDLTNAEAKSGGGGGGSGSGSSSDCDALRNELTRLEKAMQNEAKVHKALETMGRCVNGYWWNRVLGGWRCNGGAHFVTDNELAGRMGC